MQYSDSLASLEYSPREVIKAVADHMLAIRPRAEVEYHPYRKNEIYYDKHLFMEVFL